MKKLFILLTMLIVGIGSTWATLSSNTIAKSGNVTDTWNITSALSTDNWTAMGENTPAGVTALGSYTAYSRTQNLTLSADGALFISFEYSSGNHQLEILGVDLLNKDDEVVRSHYHYGKTGTYRTNNNYFLDHITKGDYKIRFIINSGVSSSAGNITIKHLNIKTANSFADISHWYFVRMNTNETHYMYYNSGATTNVAFSNAKANHDKYLWGFVKDTEGVKIYNQAAGSSVAIDNANPCTLSASGQTFTIATGTEGSNGAAAEAYFALYKNISHKNDAKNYLNYNSAGIKRHTTADEGSTFMIDEAPIAGDKIYKIKAYFSDSDDLYFTNDGTNLAFNTSASGGVNDYWILRSSGNGDYPWRFESGRGDGNFLSNNSKTEGLTNTGVYLQINNIVSESYFNLRGSFAGDAKTSSIVNLGTWTGGKSGFGAYGEGGCWSSSGNSDTGWSTKYMIEEVTGASIYTVVSNINAGGVTKTSYTGKAEQTNGGFYILSSTPSASDFTAIQIENYSPTITVDVTAKTISVNYTANITYTLKDTNGATYSWSATGSFGTTPTITGCAGLTVSNEEWNLEDRTYTADIAFPFMVSSNNITNWTYITNYSANSSKFYWYTESASATRVVVEKGVLPTNGNNTSYEWAIIPSCSNGAFSFTIKNNSTNTYVTSTSSSNSHSGVVTLSGSGSSLTYILGSSYYRWKLSTDKQLSINSSGDNQGVQELGTWGQHDGTAIKIENAEDFATLMANLKTARTSFNNYFLPWSQGKYTETVEGTMTTTYSQLEKDKNVVKDNPTAYFTASQFKSYTDNYNNAVKGLRYVVPSFFRVKNLDGSKYATAYWQDYLNYIQLRFNSSGDDAGSIFYLNDNNNIISFASGSYLFAINHTAPVGYFQYKCTYEFLPGSSVNRVYVHTVNNPLGWGDNDKYWEGGEDMINRVASPTSNSDFLIEEVTSLPVTFKSAALGYATFNSPVALKVPKDVKAYVCRIDGETIRFFNANKFTDEEGNWILPKNTAVLLYNKDYLTDATKYFTITSTTDEYEDGENDFTGTVAAASPASGCTYYSLRKRSDGKAMGFYQRSSTAGSLAGFRAWIVTTGENARNFTVIFDGDSDPTGIVEALGLENNNVEIYDLSGRKLSSYKNGINIVNGKKVYK